MIEPILIQLPETCPHCGLTNLKIQGTRLNGKTKITIRCMICGKPLNETEKNE